MLHNMKSALPTLFALNALAITGVVAPAMAQSTWQNAPDIVKVQVLEGWRMDSGAHMIGVHMTLADGWKTYWRAPGDGGLPTSLDWSQSRNVKSAQMHWPKPEVFDVAGMRSVGYSDELTIPIELSPKAAGDIQFRARMNFGICREVCVPATVDLFGVFLPSMRTSDALIKQALASKPTPAGEAGIGPATCSLEKNANGTRINVDVEAELAGTDPAMIVEHADRDVWVGTTQLTMTQTTWSGSTPYYDGRDQQIAIDFGDIRITLLTSESAIDIKTCQG